MNHSVPPDETALPRPGLGRLVYYGSGEAATSLVLNGLYGFALIFYTEALGLSPSLAGLALSISVFWEAISEPFMGHVSDRTRSRFGPRYPWIAGGALLLAGSFFMLWAVPPAFRGGGSMTFFYLVALNLVLRTSLTMFVVPYMALGFEVAPAFNDRPRLQSVRWVCNMAANMAGPALAWIVFFPDTIAANGQKVSGTSVVANFVAMGGAFSLAILVLTAIMLWGCRQTIAAARPGAVDGTAAHAVGFVEGFKPILADRHVRHVLVLIFLLVVGMVIVSSLQSYVYVHYLALSGVEKTIVHGSTMVAAALGAAISPWATRRFDKRGAIVFGALMGLLGQAWLGALFLPGYLPRSGATSIIAFMIGQGLYWAASGVVLPVATAMVADIAELGHRRTGRLVDASYSAVFSLAWRLGTSASLAITGGLLSLANFDSAEGHVPTAQSVWTVAALYCSVGAVFYVASALWVRGYGLDRDRYAVLIAEAKASAA